MNHPSNPKLRFSKDWPGELYNLGNVVSIQVNEDDLSALAMLDIAIDVKAGPFEVTSANEKVYKIVDEHGETFWIQEQADIANEVFESFGPNCSITGFTLINPEPVKANEHF